MVSKPLNVTASKEKYMLPEVAIRLFVGMTNDRANAKRVCVGSELISCFWKPVAWRVTQHISLQAVNPFRAGFLTWQRVFGFGDTF